MSLAEKLASERRGRLAAERLLELKQAELYAANRKLGMHARALSVEIVETRAEVANVRTENEKVKSDLSVAHQKVEVAERRLWHSISTIQDGFAFFDNDDCLIAANHAYQVVFEGLEEVAPGIAYARILQLLTEEGIVDTEDKSPAEWRAAMLQRRQMKEPEPVIVRLWNDEYIKIVDHRSEAGDVVSLGLNITSTVRYEKELKEARARAEDAARAKSAFLANMSHEIRTPMNGVVGMAELLADTDLNDEQQLYAETIRNSGEALLVIINDILDYSKIEAEKLVLHHTNFDLEKAIHEVLILLQPAAREKGLALLLDYDLFLAQSFTGDVGRIRQILTNLVGNAVKFTPEGHVVVRVTGVPDEDTGQTTIHVAIEDTGIGIPAEKIDHIFGEFTQVDDERNRQFEGTGLGLAITKRLVNMMNGDIWATSELGVGTCFGFRIVLEALDAPPQALPPVPESLSRILIVDDNPVNRDILRRQIELLGVATDACASGGEALQALRDPYDLIITDHLMPGMNGAEFILAARAQGETTPVIMISSNPSLLGKSEACAHISALLQRPIYRQTLVNTLTELGATLKPVDTAPATEDDAPESEVQPMFRTRSGSRTAPIAPDQTEQPTPTAAAELPVSEPSPVRKMKILAAEDNKTNQLVFRKMIKAFDIDLTFANDGIEAVEAYKADMPDLVFMDISMPRMDGKEATQTIRKIEQETGHHVPIVALTAHAMTGDSDAILEAGLDHYLTKPLRKPAIQDMILRHVPEGVIDPRVAEDIAS